MRQFTTPTIPLTVEGIDLTAFNVYVTFSQCDTVLTFDNPDMETVTTQTQTDTIINVPFSQLQTGGFQYGKALVQVNWTDNAGHRDATGIGEIGIGINLLNQVIDDA